MLLNENSISINVGPLITKNNEKERILKVRECAEVVIDCYDQAVESINLRI